MALDRACTLKHKFTQCVELSEKEVISLLFSILIVLMVHNKGGQSTSRWANLLVSTVITGSLSSLHESLELSKKRFAEKI